MSIFFLWGGSSNFEAILISGLRKEFRVGSQASGAFKYIGLEIRQTESGVTVRQQSYLESINPIAISHGRASQKDTMVSKTEKEKLQSLTGQLNWLGRQTRSDVSFDVLELSTKMIDPMVEGI